MEFRIENSLLRYWTLLKILAKWMRIRDNHMRIFIGRTDPEAEAQILWQPEAKTQLTGKDPDPEKDWKQNEKRVTENQMVGWHHRLNGHELEQIPRDDEEQGCSPWGCRELDTTEQLNSNMWIEKEKAVPHTETAHYYYYFFWLGKKNNPILPSEFLVVKLPPLFFSPFGVDACCKEDTSFLISQESINMQLEWNRKCFAQKSQLF